jgi:type IV secretory pathway TraG/TraD family ATPase VirD4
MMHYLYKNVVEGQKLLPLDQNHLYTFAEEMSDVGILGHNHTGIALGPHLLSRHLLTLGAIGSGKSNTLYHLVRAIRKVMTDRDSLIFFDAKGDYLRYFRRPRDIVISPQSGLATERWNLYQEILATPLDERDQTIREIAASMFQHLIERSQSPVFPSGARDILYALLTAHTRSTDAWNNQRLRDFISRSAIPELRQTIEAHDDLRWVLSYMMSDKGATTQSYVSPLYQAVQELLAGEFGKAGQFSMRGFVKNGAGRALFLEYDLANANVLSPIYSLLLDLAMKEMLGRTEEDEPRHTYFVLDEFPLIPPLNYLENALNFGRSLGVRVIAGIQNAAQVEDKYGPSGAQSLLAGFGTVMAFRLFDEASRRIIQQRHGIHKLGVGYMASNAQKGVVDQIVDGHVIEDWDISALDTGMAIVSLPTGEPFLFRPLLYGD